MRQAAILCLFLVACSPSEEDADTMDTTTDVKSDADSATDTGPDSTADTDTSSDNTNTDACSN